MSLLEKAFVLNVVLPEGTSVLKEPKIHYVFALSVVL